MALKILSVVGARPGFIKMAAICDAINELNQNCAGNNIQHVLVQTVQHYGTNMSEIFFNDLDLPRPDIFLGVELASTTAQTARTMEKFETVLLNERPDVVLVVGDSSSTMACALAAKKTVCPPADGSARFVPRLAHVEAGLRSFDRTMPDEINRIVTDSISDLLFTTEESANRNLVREGVASDKIHFVGNVTIDTLLRQRDKTKESTILNELQLANDSSVRPYAVLTLHRPANVDDGEILSRLLDAFLAISQRMPVIFPAHPRTLERIQETDLGDYFVDHFMEGPEPWDSRVRIRLIPPLGYVDFLRLMTDAKVVLTDSGGIQEETTMLGIPCLTLRSSTERQITLQEGTNVLVGSNPELILAAFNRVLWRSASVKRSPRFWDGQAAQRIIKILVEEMSPESLAPVMRERSTAQSATSSGSGH
jgi:UDP-N-acetylglucosamine 2-epimerase (non-hydrolysing)